MTVYVDDMYRQSIGKLGRMRMSHLIADTREELFACVDAIGVKRKWIQHFETSGEHFDIAFSKRLAAVKWGAKPITYRTCGLMCARRREEGVLGLPEEAEGWFVLWTAANRARRFNRPSGCPVVVKLATPSRNTSAFHDLFSQPPATPEGRTQ